MLAIKTALQVFLHSPWANNHALIVESDSKVVVDWIRNKEKRPWKDWKIFNEFDMVKEQIKLVDFEHVYKETNFFVDSLAKMGVNRMYLFYGWK